MRRGGWRTAGEGRHGEERGGKREGCLWGLGEIKMELILKIAQIYDRVREGDHSSCKRQCCVQNRKHTAVNALDMHLGNTLDNPFSSHSTLKTLLFISKHVIA